MAGLGAGLCLRCGAWVGSVWFLVPFWRKWSGCLRQDFPSLSNRLIFGNPAGKHGAPENMLFFWHVRPLFPYLSQKGPLLNKGVGGLGFTFSLSASVSFYWGTPSRPVEYRPTGREGGGARGVLGSRNSGMPLSMYFDALTPNI